MAKPAASSSERPGPRQTLPLGSMDPRAGLSHSPEWAARARTLISELEEILADDERGLLDFARIERVWSAWNLGGLDDESIQRVAHLVDRAYDALRQEPRRKPSRKSSGLAISSCAQVLYNGLPPVIQSQLDLSDVMAVVHELERAVEKWPAVVRATAELLGWNKTAMTHAARAIKQALATKIEPVG
jgi:hypothetical protein